MYNIPISPFFIKLPVFIYFITLTPARISYTTWKTWSVSSRTTSCCGITTAALAKDNSVTPGPQSCGTGSRYLFRGPFLICPLGEMFTPLLTHRGEHSTVKKNVGVNREFHLQGTTSPPGDKLRMGLCPSNDLHRPFIINFRTWVDH
jgi:hypothetical protein